MELEWDEDKRQKNLRERGIDFASFSDIDMQTAFTAQDNRTDYGEIRFITFGFIAERLHVACWTRREEQIRVISLRKANEREKALYADLAG